jgi:hypothetical protein
MQIDAEFVGCARREVEIGCVRDRNSNDANETCAMLYHSATPITLTVLLKPKC